MSMAKETMKDKIVRLEKEIEELKQQLHLSWEEQEKANRRYYELEEQKEDSFKQTALYKQMEREISVSNEFRKTLEKQLEQEREKIRKQVDKIFALQDVIETLQKQVEKQEHNARGAGRKEKFTGAEIEQIKMMRAGGETIRAIADYMDCSVGLVHKLINEK